jgi:twinkle protein
MASQLKSWADLGIDIRGATVGEVDTTCPQCSPTRKKKHARCLSVNLDKGVFSCHHCGFTGGLREPARNAEVAWRKPAYRRPDAPVAVLNNPTRQLLIDRGVTPEVIDRNRIQTVRVYMPQVEDHVNALAFPYYRGDELINVKYRDDAKNFRMEAGAERVLYGLNDINPDCCIIVEGEIDKLSVEVAGFTSCVSVPDGAPSETTKDYASKFKFLEADEAVLGTVKEWILAVDNDAPGQRLEEELARRLGREKCKRVVWPGECKDANDVLRSFDAQTLRECIELAQPLPIEGVFSVDQFSDRIIALYVNGWEKGVSTGWDEVDQFYTVRPGEFTVVTGIPNSGKSNWVDALMINLAQYQGWHFAVFSPENQPLEDHMARMVEKWARMPFSHGPSERMDRASLDKGMAWLNSHFDWVLPDDDTDWTIETVLDRARQLVFRKGIRGLVIDPWNELDHELPPGMTETIYVSKVLKRSRQFARRYGVHVWIVAHPQKLYRDKESGNYPVPSLYDISGSAHWRNKADNGVVIWRDFNERNSPVEIHVQKIRFRQIGRIGMTKLNYQPSTQTYSELGFEHPLNRTPSASHRKRGKSNE